KCRMHNCFDTSICLKNGFKVYIYPVESYEKEISSTYREILSSIRRSRYFTSDPSAACLFILSLDTLDRDPLSKSFVKGLRGKLNHLKYWRHGINHLIFNLYSGTWPDYKEMDIGFDVGMAMIAKTSLSQQHFRPNFDISFPLFHPEHSYRGGELGLVQSTGNLAGGRSFILVFKGKRYLSGIGSETRNFLYHLNNNRDIILLTTCKHGKDWKTLKDDRCEVDNRDYDKWDYKVLLRNSTFCLVPRGRRLGSYRFLEALQAGCIPLILSNDWVLPFSEVIDWSRALLWADERMLLQLPSLVRSIGTERILLLRQQTQFLWDTYFSSIDKIVATTLEALKDRIFKQDSTSRTSSVWNSFPGGLVHLPEYSQSLASYPFYSVSSDSSLPSSSYPLSVGRNPVPNSRDSNNKNNKYNNGSSLSPSSSLSSSPSFLPNRRKARKFEAVILAGEKSLPFSQKSFVYSLLRIVDDDGGGLLTLNEDVIITTDEIDFANHVWSQHRSQLIGYSERNHFWNSAHLAYQLTSKSTNEYSVIKLQSAFYHRYYNRLYTTFIHQVANYTIQSEEPFCRDIFMNALISHVSKRPPIKLGRRRPIATRVLNHAKQPHIGKIRCFQLAESIFGYSPFKRSVTRLDPIFHLDLVSSFRKKYLNV
ncbi:hypothetical protein HELRODRAFT_119925, partial [Helobdella robusta]|uniref:Exostosin GT47 domain-containing protein n=1 Tax=Helobdella robusta TaxID=6412 RepID=T1EGP0_HELRO